MKKLICLILSSILALGLLSGCNIANDEPPEMGFLVADQFTGYRLGTVEELVSEEFLCEKIDSPIVVKYDSVEKGLEALRANKIYGLALPAIYADMELEKSYAFLKLALPFVDKQLRAVSLSDSKFILPIDAALTSIRNDGTAEKIRRAYSPYADANDPYVRPTEFDTKKDRVITIGICSDEAYPYNFRDENGALTGINVDVAHEIAKGISAELVIKEYSEDKLFEALEAGEVDLIMSQYALSEDDKVNVKYTYSDTYCDASTHIIIRGPMADFTDEELEAKKAK